MEGVFTMKLQNNSMQKPVIGIYSIGLNAYWEQYAGLKERLIAYGEFIADSISDGASVKNFGLVDNEESAKQAGIWFNQQNVDLIFCHCATYATSSAVMPIHQICKAPVVILNLQPTARIHYEKTTTGEWLANCGSCVIPELSNAFNRYGIKFRMISGLLGQSTTPLISLADENTANRKEAMDAYKEIKEWIKAALVIKTLKNSRFGFLGNTYSGMLDLYSDFTMLQAQTGIHIEALEMCDLDKRLKSVTDSQVKDKLNEIKSIFEISGDSPSDPFVKKPTEEQLLWSAKVAAAQELLVSDYGLDALAYYYHSVEGNEYEKLQGGFIVGHSLLTAKGVPCAGEGDLKTAIAMKICDILGLGGSFCEIVVVDYIDNTILIGHDGPFHINISDRKPILRGMNVYHGKKGSGISVEAKVKAGDITTLNFTQTIEGKIKFIVSEAASVNGEIMTIGNTQTPVRYNMNPDEYMVKWFSEAPTHHFALSIGHNASLFKKVADLLEADCVIL